MRIFEIEISENAAILIRAALWYTVIYNDTAFHESEIDVMKRIIKKFDTQIAGAITEGDYYE